MNSVYSHTPLSYKEYHKKYSYIVGLSQYRVDVVLLSPLGTGDKNHCPLATHHFVLVLLVVVVGGVVVVVVVFVVVVVVVVFVVVAVVVAVVVVAVVVVVVVVLWRVSKSWWSPSDWPHPRPWSHGDRGVGFGWPVLCDSWKPKLIKNGHFANQKIYMSIDRWFDGFFLFVKLCWESYPTILWCDVCLRPMFVNFLLGLKLRCPREVLRWQRFVVALGGNYITRAKSGCFQTLKVYPNFAGKTLWKILTQNTPLTCTSIARNDQLVWCVTMHWCRPCATHMAFMGWL